MTATPEPHQQTPVTPPPALSDQQRRQVLDQYIQGLLAGGWTLQYQTDSSATLTSGNAVNHVLHALLTLFTFGAWGLIWLVLAFSGGKKTLTVWVDPYGRIDYRTA